MRLPISLHDVLEFARWAPSADNVQPWRFEILSDEALVVHGEDARENCVYDLDGRISQLGLGALLETIRIAAISAGRDYAFERVRSAPPAKPTFMVRLPRARVPAAHPLFSAIPVRSVQRRGMQIRPLDHAAKSHLSASLDADWRLMLFEPLAERVEIAKMLFVNGKLRLRVPEAFSVHRDVIRWNSRFSDEGIPDKAIGLDPVTLWLTRWAMRSWSRVAFLNRYLAGTLVPCVELDAWPALACGALFLLLSDRPLETVDDYVEAGTQVQRLWLTATSLGLQFQPTVSPLVFARYEREHTHYTSVPECISLGREVTRRLERIAGLELLPRAAFMGRLGYGRSAHARSLRLPVNALVRH